MVATIYKQISIYINDGKYFTLNSIYYSLEEAKTEIDKYRKYNKIEDFEL